MFSKKVNIIVACQVKDGGIAMNGKIPWHTPTDMKYFKETTMFAESTKKNVVIMGRKTFDTIGHELYGRINYVLSSSIPKESTDTLIYKNNMQDILLSAMNDEQVDKIFVIGGEQIYNLFFTEYRYLIEHVFITLVSTSYKCDQFFNLSNWVYDASIQREHVEDNGIHLYFYISIPQNPEEEKYINLMEKIINTGELRKNRTGVDTFSLFGERLEFNITNTIPFITTKKLAWKTMLRELLWFISGDTNNKTLQDKNVHIWDGNSSREYLDSIGLKDRPEGDLGPIYGFQWRHFGADYVDCNTDYTGKGIDQLKEVIRQIRETPDSRRIILSAWNPSALHLMALPPCHVLCQWYVRNGMYLDCQLYQRSCDVALGVPFNIASYSMLTYMLAHICNLKPGKFIHIMGDAHIYTNHVDKVREQFERHSYQFPQLRFTRKVNEIDEFKEDDFEILFYKSHDSIKMEMN